MLGYSVRKQKMRGAEGRGGRGKDGCPDAPSCGQSGASAGLCAQNPTRRPHGFVLTVSEVGVNNKIQMESGSGVLFRCRAGGPCVSEMNT